MQPNVAASRDHARQCRPRVCASSCRMLLAPRIRRAALQPRQTPVRVSKNTTQRPTYNFARSQICLPGKLFKAAISCVRQCNLDPFRHRESLRYLSEKIRTTPGSATHLTFVLGSDAAEASMPFTEATKITLEATQEVELYPGIVLPPGSYSGTKTQTRNESMPPLYRIELTEEQLASMGATVQNDLRFEQIDVSEFLRLGLLKPV